MRRINNDINVDEQEVGRWLISYADFITLLFAFFVVLYSISQVSASKYKILSQSLEGAFNTPANSPEIFPIGDPDNSLQPLSGDSIEPPDIKDENFEKEPTALTNFASSEAFKDLEAGLEASLGDLIDKELAEINSDHNWINIILKSALLFPSGSDTLNLASDPLMEEVAKHLNSNLQVILVHGHTDNIPISTEKFPSNWELSSARGVAVVRKLQELSVQPERLSVEGHGEYQPIASNLTPEGRKENRRVVISISRKQRVAEGLAVENEKRNEINKIETQDVNIVDNLRKDTEQSYDIIKLPGGGILIRGKKSPEDESTEK